MAYFTINVTQKHIDKANKYNPKISNSAWCRSCAVALATQESIPSFSSVIDVWVTKNSISIYDKKYGSYTAELPREAVEFVAKADTQLAVRSNLVKEDKYDILQETLRPISFAVYVPDHISQRRDGNAKS